MHHLIRWLKNQYHLVSALLACIYFGFPGKKLTVIGITGTDGKTTTSSLVYHLLHAAGYQVALISTVAAYIGDQQIDTGFHVTSPAPWQLQKLLRQIVNSGFTHLVLESTSHGLDQHRLYGTFIQTAVVTNVTHEHLDYHHSYNRYLQAKAKIFSSAHTAILNADDASFRQLITCLPPGCRLYPYSLVENTTPDFIPDDSYQQLKSACEQRFSQPYNQANALAAAYAALSSGVALAQIMSALPLFPGVPGRMQHLQNKRGINLVVDFAHTPNALKNALAAVKSETKGKLIAVFGSAGKRDKTKRPLMGAAADAYADEIILTAEDPRGEDVRLIINQIKSGITVHRGHAHGIADRRQAIKFALSLAKPGDTVIVCGKGHEQSMNLDGRHELPWSDEQVVQAALQ